MLKRLRSRLTYANVASSIALFVALGTGGAYAANTVGSADIIDESILSQDIKNSEVKSTEIAGAAVTNSKLGPNAVGSGKVLDETLLAADLAKDSVGTSEIANDAVTSEKILVDSVSTSEIAPDSIGRSEIIDGIIGASELDNIHEHVGLATSISSDPVAHDGSYTLGTASVSCGTGEDLLSASVDWTVSGGHNERMTVGVSSISRGEPDTAIVEAAYDGGPNTATFTPVATCIF
jgi:hypothetical protein